MRSTTCTVALLVKFTGSFQKWIDQEVFQAAHILFPVSSAWRKTILRC